MQALSIAKNFGHVTDGTRPASHRVTGCLLAKTMGFGPLCSGNQDQFQRLGDAELGDKLNCQVNKIRIVI